MSIGLDANGAFAVRSASRVNYLADYASRLDGMDRELTAHQPPKGAATPFDMRIERDTIVVFRLEPESWAWESVPAEALFLKDGQRHDPFSAAAQSPDRPRDFAVRINSPKALAGCSWDYNLGIVVNQGGQATPLTVNGGANSGLHVILDPEIKNGGTGQK